MDIIRHISSYPKLVIFQLWLNLTTFTSVVVQVSLMSPGGSGGCGGSLDDDVVDVDVVAMLLSQA